MDENSQDRALSEVAESVPFPLIKVTHRVIIDFDLSALSDDEIHELAETYDSDLGGEALIFMDEKMLRLQIEVDDDTEVNVDNFTSE